MPFSNPFARAPDISGDRSFLPDDYLQRRGERRTNTIALTLFSIVSAVVVGAFLVTNRQWHDVKRYQEAINVRYAQAAKDIEQLKSLEEQKQALLQKAELTTALIERVPKSILLAEITNRMPLDVTLLEFELKSTRINESSKADDPQAKGARTGGQKAKNPAKALRAPKGDQQDVKPVIAAPKFKSKLAMTGVTATHNSVAKYVAALQECALITGVELKFSEEAVIEEREMNRFRIEADLRPDADSRRIDPLAAPRIASDPFGPDRAPGAAAAEGSEP